MADETVKEEQDELETSETEAEESAEDVEESASDEQAAEAADDAEEAPKKKKKSKGKAEGKESKRKKKARLSKAAAEKGRKKDRNKRVRDGLLKKKRDKEDLTPLSAGELVDDAVARGASNFTKWLKANAGIVQAVVGVALVGGIGYGVWRWQSHKKMAATSGALMKGIRAEQGMVRTKVGKKSEQEVFRTFKNDASRIATARKAYSNVVSAHGGSIAADLAKLGQAGLHLDKQEWDKALTMYRAIKAGKLARGDEDVRGRCLEGIGFALEGKKDFKGALGAYNELMTMKAKDFRVIGLMHKARALLAMGKKDDAKKAVKKAKDKLFAVQNGTSLNYLKNALDDLYRQIDPKNAPKRSRLGGLNGQTSASEMAEMQRKLQEQIRKAMAKGGKHGGHNHGGGIPMPKRPPMPMPPGGKRKLPMPKPKGKK